MKLGSMRQLLGPNPHGRRAVASEHFCPEGVLNEDLEIAHPKSRMLHIHVYPENT